MSEAIGLLEVTGLTATLVAVDVMEKAAGVRLIQCELNDSYGVVAKLAGPVAAVASAIEAGRAAAGRLGGRPTAAVLPRGDAEALRAIVSPPEFNPLIQQDVVFFPNYQPAASRTRPAAMGADMSQETAFALGLIETQGFTAVFEAIDTACKVANVEVVGKEKLGGGYVTVIIRGELSAVTAALEAGQARVEGLGKLIAAHVIARPSAAVLALLPR